MKGESDSEVLSQLFSSCYARAEDLSLVLSVWAEVPVALD